MRPARGLSSRSRGGLWAADQPAGEPAGHALHGSGHTLVCNTRRLTNMQLGAAMAGSVFTCGVFTCYNSQPVAAGCHGAGLPV